MRMHCSCGKTLLGRSNICTQCRNAAKKRRGVDIVRRLKEGRKCKDCRRPYPHYVLQFDHCRGKKLCCISTAARKSVKFLLAEVKKCDLVCANCHAVRTWRRKQNKRRALLRVA